MIEQRFIYVEADKERKSGMRFFLVPERCFWVPNDDQVKIEARDVEFFVSDNLMEDNIRRKAIEALKEKQQRALTDAQNRATELQGKIDNLMLLTHNKAD